MINRIELFKVFLVNKKKKKTVLDIQLRSVAYTLVTRIFKKF